MNLKKTEEQFFRTLMLAVTLGIAVLLVFVLVVIFKRGAGALSWEMISQVPKGGFYFGKEGGILNAIVGSLYLAIGATGIAFFISLPIALYMNLYLTKRRRVMHSIRLLLDILWGVPSIIYGAFGFTLMIFLGLKTSLLAGIITLALLIVPIMIRGMDEILQTIPLGLSEASFSLGSTRSENAFKVIFFQGLPGFVTAILLAFGRAIGDAASVLFTAGYTDNMPTSLEQPTASLPLAIFFQLSSPVAEVRERAYAAAVILTIIILFISILSRILYGYFKRNTLH